MKLTRVAKKAKALLFVVAVAADVTASEPVVWYRADMGVTTNAQGKVTAWINQGSAGSAADLAANTNTAAPGVTFVVNAMGGAPALDFNGHDILTTDSSVSVGTISEGGAWFVAFKSAKVGNGANNMSVFGHGTGSSDRFGCFQNNSGQVLTYFYGQSGYIQSSWKFNGDPCIISCGTYKHTSGSSTMGIRSWFRGQEYSQVNAWSSRSGAGKLVVGDFNSTLTWDKPFEGLIAEVRIYLTPLTAAARFKIEGEMAARYSIPLASEGEFSIAAADIGGCTNSPIAIGDAYKWGKAATAETSATSGALTVAFADAPAANVNSLLYAAHDGRTGRMRAWCVVGASGARALPLELTFAGEEFTAADGIDLYRKGDSRWVKVSAEKTVQNGTVRFSLPAGWENGRYRACTPDDFVAEAVAVWYRADRGVTLNGSGMVTGWTNGGFLGSDFDLSSANESTGETPDLVVVENGIGAKPTLRFANSDYLRTSDEVDLGISSASGGAYFLVCRFDPDHADATMCPFGIWSHDSSQTASQRFGLQSATTWTPNRPVRGYFYAANAGSSIDMVRTNAAQILAVAAYPAYNSARTVASSQSGDMKRASSPISPYVGVLSIGEFNVTMNRYGFYGEVAELRIYNHPLTAREFADVELELSVRYGIDVATAGSYDAAALAAHQEDYGLIGISSYRGTPEANPPVAWSDGTLSFTFKTAPSASDANSPIAVLGHDGGAVSFAPWRSTRTQSLGRTWFVSSSNPARGGVFDFSVAMAGQENRRYQLYLKASGAEAFEPCTNECVKTAAGVTFTMTRLEPGTYRLVRKPPVGCMVIHFK